MCLGGFVPRYDSQRNLEDSATGMHWVGWAQFPPTLGHLIIILPSYTAFTLQCTEMPLAEYNSISIRKIVPVRSNN